jgi:hypothetical protein
VGGGIVFEDAAGGERGEPLAHITLAKAGPVGDLLAGRRIHVGHHVEQAGPVTDGNHEGD